MKRVPIWMALLAAAAACAEEPPPAPQPHMRPVDRDWSFFAALPCGRLDSTPVHSAAEKQLLERRRRQCLDRYRAFLPSLRREGDQ